MTSTAQFARSHDVDAPPRTFDVGSTGWTAGDLEDPAIEQEWLRGRYEIVEGVLSKMPAAYFSSGNAAFNLMALLKAYSNERGLNYRLAPEAEIVVSPLRVPRPDAVLLTADDQKRQNDAVKASGGGDPKRTRILIPPHLVIESVSPGHETHDRQTKRSWFAEFGVPNYWIVDAYAQTLECLRFEGGQYVVDAQGRGNETVRPSAFPGLLIPLQAIWEE